MTVAACLLVVVFAAFPARILGPTGVALKNSLDAEHSIGIENGTVCSRSSLNPEMWKCSVLDRHHDEYPQAKTLEIQMNGWGCWKVVVGKITGLRGSGCLRLLDYAV